MPGPIPCCQRQEKLPQSVSLKTVGTSLFGGRCWAKDTAGNLTNDLKKQNLRNSANLRKGDGEATQVPRLGCQPRPAEISESSGPARPFPIPYLKVKD